MLSIFNRRHVTNNMQIRSEIVSKFSIACENIRFSSLFAAGDVCNTATEIPYWWRKICPESGKKRWLVDGVVTLF